VQYIDKILESVLRQLWTSSFMYSCRKATPNFSSNPTLELLFAKDARANRSKNASALAHPTMVTLILSQRNNSLDDPNSGTEPMKCIWLHVMADCELWRYCVRTYVPYFCGPYANLAAARPEGHEWHIDALYDMVPPYCTPVTGTTYVPATYSEYPACMKVEPFRFHYRYLAVKVIIIGHLPK
jgi:hypothetical protein